MPLYNYQCDLGHITEQQAGYDDEESACTYSADPFIASCGRRARRQAVYPEQYVSFRGADFTRSVAPPPRPLPRKTSDASTEGAMEIWDDTAREQYEYDENVLPYVKEGEIER